MAELSAGLVLGVTEQLTNTKLMQLVTQAVISNIRPTDLIATNSPTDGDKLSYNAAGNSFTWVP